MPRVRAGIQLNENTEHFFRGDGILAPPSASNALTINAPSAAEDMTFFFLERASTVTQMIAILRGTDPSVTWTIRHDPDRTAVGTEVVTGGTTTTSKTTGDRITSFDDATIPAESFIWLETTATGGTVREFNLTVLYQKD